MMMFVFLAASTMALADDGTGLVSGELPATAHTLPVGDNQIFLGTAYGRGLTEDIEVGTSALGWLDAANAVIEYAVMQGEDQALSGALSAQYGWDGSYGVGVTPTYTLGGQQTNRFNASLGYRYFSSPGSDDGSLEAYSGSSVPLRLSYDIVPKPHTTYRLMANTNVLSIVDGAPSFAVGGAWYRGWDVFRLALGVQITNQGLSALGDVLDLFGLGTDLPAVYPAPYIRLWWRF